MVITVTFVVFALNFLTFWWELARWLDGHPQPGDYSATHSGGSFSTGGPVGKDLLTNMAGGMLSGANHSGHAEGATKAGVSEVR